jgi:peptidoglycan/LPS O-acetylase OafA/YrhL
VGWLRFVLAIAILFTHAGPFSGLVIGDYGGRLAVQTFFMISGFYMGLVWNEKYSQLPMRVFYISRALRIYPIYFIVLILTFMTAVVCALRGIPFPVNLSDLNLSTLVTSAFSQIVLFFVDLNLIPSFGSYRYLLVPPAWTLGLELLFYLLVPFILPRFKVVFVCFILSILARFVAHFAGLSGELWSYRFFPFELALFLAGALSYRLYLSLPSKILAFASHVQVQMITVFLVFGGLIYFPFLLLRLGEVIYWIYYVIIFFSLIVLFLWSRNSNFDRMIGEFSFPIYISHIPIIWLLINVLHIAKEQNTIYVVLPATIGVSFLLIEIQKRIDQYRHLLKG